MEWFCHSDLGVFSCTSELYSAALKWTNAKKKKILLNLKLCISRTNPNCVQLLAPWCWFCGKCIIKCPRQWSSLHKLWPGSCHGITNTKHALCCFLQEVINIRLKINIDVLIAALLNILNKTCFVFKQCLWDPILPLQICLIIQKLQQK